MKIFLPHPLLLLSLLFLLPQAAPAEEVQARAEVEPNPVMAGSSASYQIRFLNAGNIPDLNRPRVQGLAFQEGARSGTQTSIVNGRVSRETSLTWNFTATEPGSYTIPGRTVKLSGGTASIPDVTFRVLPPDEEARSRAFLELDLPDGPYYTGQSIPAELRLLVRADIDLRQATLPERQGERFVHSELSEDPRRLSIQREGRSYRALVWDLTLTPVRSGKAELRFSQRIAINLPNERRQSFGVFGFNNRPSETRTLNTDNLATEIRTVPDPPSEGIYPEAIGSFSVERSLSSTRLTVGEPVTMELVFEGSGNFNSMEAPELDLGPDWRTYPPKSSFSPTGSIPNFKGTQTVSYILIPQSESTPALPPQIFHTFNPDEGLFEKHSLPAIPVQIDPAPASDSATTVFLDDEGNTTNTPPAQTAPESILPLRPDFQTIPAPATAARQTLLLNAALAAAFLAAAAARRRYLRQQADPRRRLRKIADKQIRQQLKEADQFAQKGEVRQFLQITRTTLRQIIAHLGTQSTGPDSLSTSDCRYILLHAQAPQPLLQQTLRLLQIAEAAHFANQLPQPADLPGLARDLRQSLDQLQQLATQ